jgi:protein-disulfide isomerase
MGIVNEELNLSKRTWIIFVSVVVVLFGGLILLSNSSKIDVSKVNTNALQTANKQDGNIADHVYGVASSKVVLIEYGDFQCPYCGNEHPIIKQVTEQYKGEIAFVFRNFPLTSLHPDALAAAGAVEAAGLQGQYWEMHNYIFENQSDWDSLTGTDRTNKFISYAKQFNLNTTKFASDMSSDAVSSKISYDEAIGQKLGVDSTPTFYLDGNVVDETVWSDATKLSDALNTELAKYGIKPPAVTTTSS